MEFIKKKIRETNRSNGKIRGKYLTFEVFKFTIKLGFHALVVRS